MIAYIDNKPGKPCSNSKFMHICSLSGMSVRNSVDLHAYEEVTMVYRGDSVMAMRVMDCVHFPNTKPKVECFLFDYYKGIENE